MWGLPVVVTLALGASLLDSKLLLPAHLAAGDAPPPSRGWFFRLQTAYRIWLAEVHRATGPGDPLVRGRGHRRGRGEHGGAALQPLSRDGGRRDHGQGRGRRGQLARPHDRQGRRGRAARSRVAPRIGRARGRDPDRPPRHRHLRCDRGAQRRVGAGHRVPRPAVRADHGQRRRPDPTARGGRRAGGVFVAHHRAAQGHPRCGQAGGAVGDRHGGSGGRRGAGRAVARRPSGGDVGDDVGQAGQGQSPVGPRPRADAALRGRGAGRGPGGSGRVRRGGGRADAHRRRVDVRPRGARGSTPR